MERLQKIIAAAGIASRRKAEELITAGRVQVNGKVRDKLRVTIDTPAEEVERLSLARPRIQEFTAGKTVRKIIVVLNKLVNIVAT